MGSLPSELRSAYEYNNKKGNTGAGTPFPDVDTVLTTRDLSRLFKKLSINLAKEKKWKAERF